MSRKTDSPEVSPLERGVRKLDVLMRNFGMRTKMFKGRSRGQVKGARKNYPYEVKATVVETARGIGIRINSEKIWYSFLKAIPFFLLTLVAIFQLALPKIGEQMGESIGINLLLLLVGTNPNSVGIIVSLLLLCLLIIGSEIIERVIRIKYIQDRMPRFLSGAEWVAAEPASIVDIFSAVNNIFWLMWLLLLLMFAPFAFSTDILNKFITVYNSDTNSLLRTTSIMSLLDVAIISSSLFVIIFINFRKFREEVDSAQIKQRINEDIQVRTLFENVVGSIVVASIEYAVFYFMFWNNITVINSIIFFLVSAISAVVTTWLYWQKENYIFIFIEIWLFISIVVMVFINANNASFSWTIIFHLFLILIILGLSFNLSLRTYLEKKGLLEPSWLFNPIPIITYIELLKKRKVKGIKGAKKELEEIRKEELTTKIKERPPLVISIKKIREKGKEAEKIIQTYEKITRRIANKKMDLLTLTAVNQEILKLLKDNKGLQSQAVKLFSTVDELLWNEKYRLKNGDEILSIAEAIYAEVLKTR